MSQVLYRKYRSKSFGEIIGQDSVVSILKESISSDSVSHAYLFCGPRGTGKTSIARIFSRAINCLNFKEKGDVCNECDNCISILNEQSMDIVEMDAASNRGIEEIRNLKDSINYLPTSLIKKIYIIDEAHMLTKEAFNALLKTLEEPPSHVIFILATTEAHKLPLTILSRVQRYDFRLASKEELTKKLKYILKNEDKEASDDIWDVIYTKSGGSYRDAESLVGKLISNSEGKLLNREFIYEVLGIYSDDDIKKLIDLIAQGDINGIINKIDDLNNISGNISTLIDQILENLRDRILEDGAKSNNYIELINLFIKIKRDIRDFSDKKVIFQLNLINFTSGKLGNKVEPTIKKSVVPKADLSIEKNDELVESVESKTIAPIDDSTLNSKIANHKLIKVPRLKAIIMNSEIEINDGILTLYNKYKFNVAFLSKQEIREIIEKIIKEINENISNINFIVKEDAVGVMESSQSVEEAKEEAKKDIPAIDNSEIIENLF